MRYLSIWRPASGEEGGMPTAEHMAAMGKLVEEMMASGKLLATEPLMARSECLTLSNIGGAYTIGEVEERAAGYALMQADSREELIEMSKTFLSVAGEGTCEIRAILEFAPAPA